MNTDSTGKGMRPPSSRPEEASTSAMANTQNRPFLLVLGLLVVLALVVVFVLPAQLDRQAQVQNKPLPPVARTTIPAPPSPASGSVARESAQQSLQTFLRLRASAVFNHADIWADPDWEKALLLADEGDTLFGQGKFKAAGARYETAIQQLTELQNARPDILSNTLRIAQDSLRNNDAEAAIESYEKVLLMQTNHPQATLELMQAKVRGVVLQKMLQAQQAQSGDQLEIAKRTYIEILALDPGYSPAELALKAVQDTIDKQAYQTAMSDALAKLQAGKFSDAGKALDTAAAIRPGNSEIKDARLSLKLAIKQASLNRLRSQSGKLALAEQWENAAALYQQALTIEPQAGFALSGLAHAQARSELHRQLDHYLDNPQRLSSDQPLHNAQALLKGSLPLENKPLQAQKEPKLSKKLNSLKNAIEQASLPVSLVIESDELTKISIYHVGQLGSFQRKQLTLRPGRYTLVGSRVGYHDVRKIIDISPNTPVQLQLRCEKSI